MKLLTTLTLLLAFLPCTRVPAQIEYGTVSYKIVDVDLPKPEDGEEKTAMQEQMEEMMAKLGADGGFDRTYDLTFTPRGFTYVERMDKKDKEINEGGMRIIVHSRIGDPNHYYTVTETGETVNSLNITDRHFLVTDRAEIPDWQLTDQRVPPSSETSGMELRIATAVTAEGDSLVAGYAPALPVQFGPENYYGLPGAILKLAVYGEKKKTVYTMEQMEVSSTPLELTIPTAGKPISRKKFMATSKKVRERQQMRIRN